MTGYGEGEERIGEEGVYVEIKTINDRFLKIDINSSTPLPFNFERLIKKYIEKEIKRGRVIVRLKVKEKPSYKLKINKDLLCQYYKTFLELAQKLEVKEKPSLANLLNLPEITRVEKKEGKLREKIMEKALKKAQELGYAEADPTGDVEGLDALGKVVILTNVVLGKELSRTDVKRKGITGISMDDVKHAKEHGKRWKLIGRAEIQKDSSVLASVSPEKLPLSDPLAGVNEAVNALTFMTDELGPVTIIGPGAGKRETGFALLIDMINMKYQISR